MSIVLRTLIIVCLAAHLVGCSGGGEVPPPEEPPVVATPTPAPTPTPRAPEILQLEGGIEVQVTQWGTGQKPGARDSVRLTYVLRTAEGEELDASAGKPGTFEVGMDDPATLPGLVRALGELSAGSRAIVRLPAVFAFGDRGYADIIPPGATLVMEIEVLEVVPAP